MSIEIAGPQGYAHQYRVTAWIGLLIADPDASLIVEPKGGEDALLRSYTTEDGQERSFEVQVKKETTDVDAALLAEWLLHFPDRDSTRPLIERVSSDDQVAALFVAGGSVSDAIRSLRVKLHEDIRSLEPHSSTPTVLTTELKSALQTKATLLAGSDLADKRREHALQYLKTLTTSQLRLALKRVFIVDRIGPMKVRALVEPILTRKYQIPLSDAWPLFDEKLCRAVETARNSRSDVLLDIRALLFKHSAKRVTPTNEYIERSEQAELLVRLKNDGVLLLCGASTCGKTDLARSLLSERQAEGWVVQEFERADEVLRQIRAQSQDDRVILLHDPFGKSSADRNATDKLSTLSDILRERRGHVELIVTSRSSVLRSVLGEDATTWALEGHEWADLTLIDAPMAVAIWEGHCKEEVSGDVTETVSKLLKEADVATLLQPGQLKHLAGLARQGKVSTTQPKLLDQGRYNARGLAKELETSNVRRVAGALVLLCSTVVSVADRDLAFVLSDSSERPGRRIDSGSLGLTSGPCPAPPSRVPAYLLGHFLSDDDKEALDQLEQLGFIRRVHSQYRFAHPDYQRAVLISVNNAKHYAFERFLQLAERACLSLSPSSSANATRTLARLCELECDSEREESLRTTLLLGLQSIFPGCRDAALVELIAVYDELTQDEQVIVRRGTSTMWALRDRIIWDGDTPWYDPRETKSMRERYEPVGSEDERLGATGRVAGGNELTARDVWILLHSRTAMENHAEHILRNGLASRVSVLRARAARLLGERHVDAYHDLFTVATKDTHPLVVGGLIEALLTSWGQLTRPSQQAVLAWVQSFGPVQAGPLVRKILLTYDKFEVAAKEGKASWELWFRVMVVVLTSLPPEDRLHAPRLHGFAESGLRHVSEGVADAFLEAWLGWLLRCVEVRDPDEYAMSVLSLALTHEHVSDGTRLTIATEMLNTRDTSIRITAIRELIDEWEDINEELQMLAVSALEFQTEDVRWLRAVALTRSSVPDTIQDRLLPTGVKLHASGPGLVDKLSTNLLHDCICVHTGHPQPLWWIGTHHADAWVPAVIEELLHRPTHPLFKEALRELLRTPDKRIRELVGAAIARIENAEELEAFVDALLQWSVRDHGYQGIELWAPLRTKAEELVRFEYVQQQIFSNAEALEYAGNFFQIVKIAGVDGAFEREFHDDLDVFFLSKTVPKLLGDPAPAELKTVGTIIGHLYDLEAGPRLQSTHDFVHRFGSRFPSAFEDGWQQKIVNAEQRTSNAAKDQREKHYDHYELSNWLTMRPNLS